VAFGIHKGVRDPIPDYQAVAALWERLKVILLVYLVQMIQ
jgi:hypothetical protein